MYLFNFVMVVLGCHISYIQVDRVKTAIMFSHQLNDSTLWFLTGGIKNDLYKKIKKSEAENMLKYFSNKNFVYIDDQAKNTAENFINLKKFLTHKLFGVLPQIVITTSEFHKKRAEKIFKSIFYSVEPIWNLSNVTCDYCQTNENAFMANIENDVNLAFANDIY